MSNKLKTQKSILILPNGCFVFSKSVCFKDLKNYVVYNINLDNSSIWIKKQDNDNTIIKENIELFGYRNKFKVQ